jgi:hypothetical protein
VQAPSTQKYRQVPDGSHRHLGTHSALSPLEYFLLKLFDKNRLFRVMKIKSQNVVQHPKFSLELE